MQEDRQPAILLGYSGHAFVVAEAALFAGIKLLGYADSTTSDLNPYNLTYLGDETKADFAYWEVCKHFVLGVGANTIRAKIAKRVTAQGGICLAVIHPSASLATNIQIGSGTFVARNAAVNPLVQIGQNVILNTSCSVDHECRIADNAHIAPGAVLAGNVTVGDGAFVGANAVVKEGITIGTGAIIGAGSVVINNVQPGEIVAGNPAKFIR